MRVKCDQWQWELAIHFIRVFSAMIFLFCLTAETIKHDAGRIIFWERGYCSTRVGGACFLDYYILFSYFVSLLLCFISMFCPCISCVWFELLRRASEKLDHLSSRWRRQIAYRARSCDQATRMIDLLRRIRVFEIHCCRHFVPEQLVRAVHMKVAGRV
jgi:hypothetical protein